jgi:hypothetical protein
MKLYDKLLIKVVNSALYYHLYYKHTRKHKRELKAVYDGVMKRRKEIIGR